MDAEEETAVHAYRKEQNSTLRQRLTLSFSSLTRIAMKVVVFTSLLKYLHFENFSQPAAQFYAASERQKFSSWANHSVDAAFIDLGQLMIQHDIANAPEFTRTVKQRPAQVRDLYLSRNQTPNVYLSRHRDKALYDLAVEYDILGYGSWFVDRSAQCSDVRSTISALTKAKYAAVKNYTRIGVAHYTNLLLKNYIDQRDQYSGARLRKVVFATSPFVDTTSIILIRELWETTVDRWAYAALTIWTGDTCVNYRNEAGKRILSSSATLGSSNLLTMLSSICNALLIAIKLVHLSRSVYRNKLPIWMETEQSILDRRRKCGSSMESKVFQRGAFDTLVNPAPDWRCYFGIKTGLMFFCKHRYEYIGRGALFEKLDSRIHSLRDNMPFCCIIVLYAIVDPSSFVIHAAEKSHDALIEPSWTSVSVAAIAGCDLYVLFEAIGTIIKFLLYMGINYLGRQFKWLNFLRRGFRSAMAWQIDEMVHLLDVFGLFNWLLFLIFQIACTHVNSTYSAIMPADRPPRWYELLYLRASASALAFSLVCCVINLALGYFFSTRIDKRCSNLEDLMLQSFRGGVSLSSLVAGPDGKLIYRMSTQRLYYLIAMKRCWGLVPHAIVPAEVTCVLFGGDHYRALLNAFYSPQRSRDKKASICMNFTQNDQKETIEGEDATLSWTRRRGTSQELSMITSQNHRPLNMKMITQLIHAHYLITLQATANDVPEKKSPCVFPESSIS